MCLNVGDVRVYYMFLKQEKKKSRAGCRVCSEWCPDLSASCRLIAAAMSLISGQSRRHGRAQRGQEVIPLLLSVCGTDPTTTRPLQDEGVAHIYRGRTSCQTVGSYPVFALLHEEELTARVCDLSDSQAGQSHRRLEGVCAAVSQRERRVMHHSPRQHQSVTEQEQADLGHLLVDPDQTNQTLHEFGSKSVPGAS